MTHESGSKQVVNLLDEAVSFIDDEREAGANGFDDGGYGASHNPAPEGGGKAPPYGGDDAGEGVKKTPRGRTKKSEGQDRAPPEPRSFGYDIDLINEQYSLVLLGSKAVVFMDQPEAPVDDQQRILKIEAFNTWFSNKFTEVLSGDKLKVITWAQAWMQSSKRRSYKGIEFFPDPKSTEGMKDYLNLWSGFSVKPQKPKDGKCKYAIFKDHLLNNVCDGNQKYFRWVFGFFAHIVQRPRERIGVAIVMRGDQGVGKTKAGEVFGSLYPRHYFLVDEPRYITGQFNAHMASCLLLQAEEAVWAGDKAAEGRLKGLVTSPIQQIESKGVDPIRLKNYVRIIMTSNNEWVVPAGKDERRFAVFDINPRCMRNYDYFREMDEELNNGGREELLYDLLNFDLSSVELRSIPRTKALLEQKIRSLNSVESWWFECLVRGTQLRSSDDWSSNVSCAKMIDDYIQIADRAGVKRRSTEVEVGMKLRELVPKLVKERSTCRETSRFINHWFFPSLNECRDFFAEKVQQDVDWSAM
jgi:hypothetical protein